MNYLYLFVIAIIGIAALWPVTHFSGKGFPTFDNESTAYVITQRDLFGLIKGDAQSRDKRLVKTAPEDIIRIEWIGLGLKQVIQKEDGVWYYAGMEAVDSLKFTYYFNTLVTSQGAEFSELTSTEGLTLAEQLILYSTTMEAPTQISAYRLKDNSAHIFIQSSANPQAIFRSDSAGLYKSLFTDIKQFWPNGQ